MIKTFFKTTVRAALKNKGYTFLNVFGLAIGIVCAGLIFLWVENEQNFDQFNAKKDRLYYVRENQKYDTYVATFGSTPALMGPAMQAEIPGIANTCRIAGNYKSGLVTVGDKSFYTNGTYTDASLFSMFSFPFVQGNANTAFQQLYSMVITEATAKKFFGAEKNVVGKTIRLDNTQNYVITGVIKDIPQNSSVRFEWAAPFKIWYDQSPWAASWGNNCLNTYVELKPNVSPATVNALLKGFIQKRDPNANVVPFLFSMNDWHLRDEFENGVQTGGGQIAYVRLFSIIAWIILLIACINFMNLATARSEKRAREVGVRKVLGAAKQSLIFQFIGEAVFMALLSAIIAVLLMSLVLPAFNLLVQQQLTLGLGKPLHILALLGITLICGLVAGSYPSFYLSSFNPVLVLKGLKLKTGSANLIRKGLVVLQFCVSTILIISTIIIFQQIQHVKSRSLGFNKNNLLQITTNAEFTKNYTVIKEDLINTGLVQNLAASDYTALYNGNNTGGLVWEGKTANNQVLISNRGVSPGFMDTYGLKILSGRDFVETDSASTSKKTNIMITKALEKMMGDGPAVGKTLRWEHDTSGQQFNIIGVVNDFVYGDMYGKPDPVMFYCQGYPNTSQLYVRLKPTANTEAALKQIESVLKKDNPSYPFTYQFVDDQFNRMFLNEQLISQLSRLFAALAIIISCLGLFGLAAYTAERRKKEIGVRKVLGATVSSITALLSKDFLQLVAVACLVAFPLAWWVMENWLQNYKKYRIEISWWIFLVAGLVALLIALLTISFQSIKAAVANPAKNLRTE